MIPNDSDSDFDARMPSTRTRVCKQSAMGLLLFAVVGAAIAATQRGGFDLDTHLRTASIDGLTSAFWTPGAVEITMANFEAKTQGKQVFLLFCHPSGRFCRNMNRDWDKLIGDFKDNENLLVGSVDCQYNGRALCDVMKIQGWPIIKYGDPEDLDDYEGGRSYNNLKGFADDLAAGGNGEGGGHDPTITDREPTAEITKDNFEEKSAGKQVFIMFCVPWGQFCKRMVPAWEKLIEDFKDSETLLVGAVDCTNDGRSLCVDKHIQGFPTLWYGDPEDLQDYMGSRDYDDLKTFADGLVKTKES